MIAAPVRLGAWEKALVLEHRRDEAYCAGWLVELDRPLDPALVAAALAATRAAFPVYFARVRVDDDGVGVSAAPEPERPIDELLRYRERFAGGAPAYARALANARLDPLRDGLFRCHLVAGPVPLLAFQTAHVAGDGYSNSRLRLAFAEALAALAGGRAAELTAPAAAHDLALDEVQAALPMDARALADLARRVGRPRFPQLTAPQPAAPESSTRTLTAPANGYDDGRSDGDAYELRTFQAAVEAGVYARVVARARRLGVTPPALLGAAFAGAVRTACDPADAAPGGAPDDFLGVAVPRDLRGLLGRAGQIGNLSYPQGIPVFADDPADDDALAAVFFDRMQRGATNRLLYRHFLTGVRAAAAARVPAGAPPERRLPRVGGRLVLEPFAAFGVTEVPHRGEVTELAGSRVVRTIFQTPMLTRRFAEGRAHLSCAVRWHPAFDARLRALFGDVIARLFEGAPVAWELL